ncbi:hypothetical protein [Xanthomonas indica]|uniref:Uncharacterized protein n=1 Tax=Xanthomonas indica TaxID=2912242 RepID=A0AAU8IAK5_9XANT|nr:hypothetical protein [Xanthomonas indica]MCI2259917.1 hypothetical protein [Xanthomonas indica]
MNTHDATNGKSVDDTAKVPTPKNGDLDREAPQPDPQAGIAREVGDLEDAEAVDEDGALPGRAGGGLAGG